MISPDPETGPGAVTDQGGGDGDQAQPDAGQRLLGEMFGTFALTSVATAGPIVDKLSPDGVPLVARASAPALMIMAMIYALGHISGAHFNPAVTFAFALRRDFTEEPRSPPS